MSWVDVLLDYLVSSNSIHFFVLIWLSIYFVMVLWIFFYKYFSIRTWIKKEEQSLHYFQEGRVESAIALTSLKKCIKSGDFITKERLEVCKHKSLVETTSGLTILSMIASTAPFIGLFGTVVSILDSFSKLGGEMRATLDVIAPVISEALIATAAGIFVAIPAYSFHLLIKRKSFLLISLIQMQIDLYMSSVDELE